MHSIQLEVTNANDIWEYTLWCFLIVKYSNAFQALEAWPLCFDAQQSIGDFDIARSVILHRLLLFSNSFLTAVLPQWLCLCKPGSSSTEIFLQLF